MSVAEPLHRRRGWRSRSTSSGRSSSRLAVRSSLRANRGSSASSGTPSTSHELAELAVVAGGDDQVAVGGRQRLVGEQARVGVAHPEGHDAAGDVGAGLVDQPGQRRGEQVDLDVLARAGRVRGGAARRGSPMVACRPAITSKTEMPARYGRPVGVAGQAHQAGHRLHDQVVAGQVAAAARAEAADRGVDDARVGRRARCRSRARTWPGRRA